MYTEHKSSASAATRGRIRRIGIPTSFTAVRNLQSSDRGSSGRRDCPPLERERRGRRQRAGLVEVVRAVPPATSNRCAPPICPPWHAAHTSPLVHQWCTIHAPARLRAAPGTYCEIARDRVCGSISNQGRIRARNRVEYIMMISRTPGIITNH